jgi:predicted short-subunit dehydrogenase-like oxidoreductase (DUF2520 family)
MSDPRILDAVCIVGAGRVGSNLARWLSYRSVEIVAIISPRIAAKRALIEAVRPVIAASQLDRLPRETRHIFLCVPDACISQVATQLAPVLPVGRELFIAHTSGLHGTADFKALYSDRILAGSFHPVQSFGSDDIGLDAMRGIGVGLEGDDRFARRAGDIACSLGWTPLRIRPERKALYHAACVFAGNFLPVIAAEAYALLADSVEQSPDRDFLRPMMNHVLDSLTAKYIGETLTGPAARGDIKTIAAHLEAVSAKSPRAASLYAECSKRILDLKMLDAATRERMLRLLEPYLDPDAA